MHTETVQSARSRVVKPAGVQAAMKTGLEELLAAFAPPRRYTRLQYLFRTGEACTGLYLLQQGSVKVSTLSPNGDEQIVGFYLPGELLGLEALGESRHSSSAVALEDSRVQVLSLPVLQALYEKSPGLYHRLLQLVSRRIAELQDHMLVLGRRTAAERLAAFLIDFTRRTHTPELTLAMSRDAVGSYLGMTLETVSRLLHKFEKERLISLHGRRINLVEPTRLRQLAEGALAHAA